jgi:hypothetical protein
MTPVETIEQDEDGNEYTVLTYPNGTVIRTYKAKAVNEDPAPRTHLAPLAFRRRFTKAERAEIEWAAVDRADQPEEQRRQAAALRSELKDQEQAQFIDLADPDVAAGLDLLVQFGLLAEERKDEILSAPVTDEELP